MWKPLYSVKQTDFQVPTLVLTSLSTHITMPTGSTLVSYRFGDPVDLGTPCPQIYVSLCTLV